MRRENPQVVSIDQLREEQEKALKNFESFSKKGDERYGRLKHARGELPKETAEARDDFFEKNYVNKQFGRRDEDDPNAPVNYKAVLKGQSWDNPLEKRGLYVNEFDLARGRITADQNYGGKEEYFDPKTGKAEPYNNSEVIYQQWKQAKKLIPEARERLQVLRRAHVSGDGIPVVKAVKVWLQKNDPEFSSDKNYVFGQGHPCFYALLAAANCAAAIYLIADHGTELGIHGISTLILEAGESIEIKFI
jgi:hypothetical protein